MVPRRLGVAVLVVVAAGAAYVVLGGTSSHCDRDEITVDGSCAAPRAGTPVDPPRVPALVAGYAIDSVPGPGFMSRCRFRGVAGGGVDVYLCHVHGGVDGRLTMRLEHERASPWYRYVIRGQRDSGSSYGTRLSERGDCAVHGNPPCPLWSAYGERLAKALLPRRSRPAKDRPR